MVAIPMPAIGRARRRYGANASPPCGSRGASPVRLPSSDSPSRSPNSDEPTLARISPFAPTPASTSATATMQYATAWATWNCAASRSERRTLNAFWTSPSHGWRKQSGVAIATSSRLAVPYPKASATGTTRIATPRPTTATAAKLRPRIVSWREARSDISRSASVPMPAFENTDAIAIKAITAEYRPQAAKLRRRIASRATPLEATIPDPCAASSQSELDRVAVRSVPSA